jgi:hypothetical protein
VPLDGRGRGHANPLEAKEAALKMDAKFERI